jgi:hypothetical protein
MPQLDPETIVENSVLRFKQSLGWKADWIDAEDIEKYKAEIRRVILEARK